MFNMQQSQKPTQQTDSTFGASVLKFRVRRELSQRQLAEKLTTSGMPVDASAVSRIEAGQRSVRLAEAVIISDVLNVPLMELLKFEHQLQTAHRWVDESMRELWQAIMTVYANVQDVEDLLESESSPALSLPTAKGTQPADRETYRAWLAVELAHKIGAGNGYSVESEDDAVTLEAIPQALLDLSLDVVNEPKGRRDPIDEIENFVQPANSSFEDEPALRDQASSKTARDDA